MSTRPVSGCFGVNGAAAKRPRKVRCMACGRAIRLMCVNGAAAKRPRKAVPAARRRARCMSVNGAAAKRPRKGGNSSDNGSVQLLASMGPRPNGRGKLTAAEQRQNAGAGVNGAAAKRPRKAGGLRQVRAAGTMASMGPRPNGRGKPAAPPMAIWARTRQWGRGQTAAESWRYKRRCRQSACVNGAAAKRPRKVVSPPRRPVSSAASMGPRPNGRGKSIGARGRSASFQRQWGRGQTAAESLSWRCPTRPPTKRQWGRGQTAAESFSRVCRI